MSDVFLPKLLKEDAVYWASVPGGGSGNSGYDRPIEIKCRWEEMATEFTAMDGTTKVSRARVMVDRDLVPPGGILRYGTLNVLDDTDDPFGNSDVYVIQGWERIPNIRAAKFVRTAVL